MFRTLFGYTPSLGNIMLFGSKRVAMCLRRKRAEVHMGRLLVLSATLGFTFRPTHQNLLNSSTSVCIPKHYPMNKGRASPGVVWFAVVFLRLLLGLIYFHHQNFPKLYQTHPSSSPHQKTPPRQAKDGSRRESNPGPLAT
jgi:hypothetical protein